MKDPRTAPIPERDKAMLIFVERVNARSFELERAEVDALKHLGWSDEAIYDAVSVCALFNFYNRWCDATGVHPMSHEDHLASGGRLARLGYLPPGE